MDEKVQGPKDEQRSRAAVVSNDLVFRMRGEWRDRIFRAGELVEDSGWRPNQIQNSDALLLAHLMKNTVGQAGILYFAYGTGLVSWDASPPTLDPGDTTLVTEVLRQAVPIANITFRDPSTYVDIDPTPSNVIEVEMVLTSGEANGSSLREFGIFGGDASGAGDSGYMVNWVRHGRIDKDSTMTIQRSVRFTFEVV